MIKKSLLCTALSVTAFSGWAQDTRPDTLVVTANRFQQPRSAVLAPITVVTRQDIDRWQSTSVNDVLRRLPGVDIAQYGGMGQNSSISIRGTNASHVLVLIDGVRLNLAGVSGAADLSQFPVSLVQRIEYIRGPRSAVYGSDAIGGVVNIITTREKPGTELTAGVGSNGYQNYDVSTQQQLGENTRVTLMGDYAYTKGFDVVAYGSTGSQAQPDKDGFLSKTLYGATTFPIHGAGLFAVMVMITARITTHITLLARRSSIPENSTAKAGMPDCVLMASLSSRSWFRAIAIAKTTTMIRIMVAMTPRPHWMR